MRPPPIRWIMAYQLVPLYNLGAGVGRNCPNHHSDVVLVESLLLTIYEERSLDFWKSLYRGSQTPFPDKMPQPRGRYDEQLQGWIDFFLAAEKAQTTQDGRFDPLPFKDGTLRTAKGDGKRANFYMLMFRAFTSNSRKFMAIGSKQNYNLAIEFPEGYTSRQFCNM